MSSNEEFIRERYKNPAGEDARSSLSRANGLEFLYTKKLVGEYIDKNTSVAEIGCATGHYGMYFADKCRDYTGIDLTPESIELFREKIKQNGLTNVTAAVGDATKLDNIEDSRFDAVLCLGPMYHLPPEEREAVFSECKRICKQNGVIIFSYINKVAAYIKGCMLTPAKYPNKTVNDFILNRGVDDIHSEVFFFTMPEDMEERARAHGLSVLRNAGVNFTFTEKLINDMTDEQFKAWLEIADFMCSHPSCTGLSIHALLICRKS